MGLNLKLDQLSIVIPVYNEEKNIKKLWIKIKSHLNLKKYEIIYVDDDSEDNSFSILKEINKSDKKVKYIIRKKKPRDLSKSCILGFEKSKYKNILVMDGDLQHDPKYISKLIKKYNSTSSDIIVGCRDFYSKKNTGLNGIRTLASIMLNLFINSLLGNKTSDPMSGFFLFKKKILKKGKKNFYKKGYKILADIIYSNHDYIKISDLKINFKKRLYGKSKISIKILFFLIFFIFKRI
tara:strand:- start:794 stop:1504 length:711 start_codon:yes stop_codon:yes gene_type:complete